MGFDQSVLLVVTILGETLGITLFSYAPNIMHTFTLILTHSVPVARFGRFAFYNIMIALQPQSAGIPCILPERRPMHTPVVIFIQYSTQSYDLIAAVRPS